MLPFSFTVKSLERLGVSAVVIEDKTGLKKILFLGQSFQTQASIEEFRENYHKKVTNSFMIISRIESLILGKGMMTCLLRADYFINAGSDGIMIHSREKSPNEIFEFL